ncbi:MAG: gluconate 2-dehydrogenase subunit 3 family protein [Campylobacterota bacterium]|nr:gluconate 2-dehydrogenase subunit 3 family protein [Campylobacterota bacterium]
MKKNYSRRTFLKAGFLSSAVIIMNGCSPFAITTSRETISVVQNDLFPKAQELKINTSEYITLLLRHSRVSDEDKEFLKNGVKWLNETAVEMHKKIYTKLPQEKRQDVLNTISDTQWGESWMYNMMTYIFEAALGDPIYGGNNKEAGWKWLKFSGGMPRPTKAYL